MFILSDFSSAALTANVFLKFIKCYIQKEVVVTVQYCNLSVSPFRSLVSLYCRNPNL